MSGPDYIVSYRMFGNGYGVEWTEERHESWSSACDRMDKLVHDGYEAKVRLAET